MRHYRLSDVNELSGAVADYMHAENPLGITIKQQFEHSVVIVDNLPTGQLEIPGNTPLKRLTGSDQ